MLNYSCIVDLDICSVLAYFLHVSKDVHLDQIPMCLIFIETLFRDSDTVCTSLIFIKIANCVCNSNRRCNATQAKETQPSMLSKRHVHMNNVTHHSEHFILSAFELEIAVLK